MKSPFKKCKVCGNLMEKGLNSVCSRKCEELRKKEKKKADKIKKESSVSFLMKKADDVFGRYTRLRDAIKTTGGIDSLKCYTCDRDVPFADSQNMHFLSRRFYRYRYDEVNCHGGCLYCNVMLHGNYIEYFLRMEEQYGREKIDEMIALSKTYYKLTVEELRRIIEHYENEIKELQSIF